MADERIIQPWEQQVNESDKSFEAFRLWLFSERPRPNSCRKVEAWLKGQKRRPLVLKVVPGYRTINIWMTEHDWIGRSKRYDVHLLGAEVDGRTEARRDAGYNDELAQYRDRVVTAGRIIEDIGRLLGAATINWLRAESIDANTGKPTNNPIPQGVAQAARAAEALISKGLDTQAGAIGIDEILGTLSRSRRTGAIEGGADEVDDP